jgi:N-methylhydantoinase A
MSDLIPPTLGAKPWTHSMSPSTFRLAIDVGGTFTDVVLIDDQRGKLWFAKVLSTPDDPSRGSLTGVAEILDRTETPPSAVRDVAHATTVATNAVLEGKGAPTGLIATAGFRDVLEMGREARYDIYDLGIRMPPSLAPRRRRMEVSERVTFDGNILTPLDEAEVEANVRRLVEDEGIQSLAICLLHGYAHPDHELIIAAIAKRLFPNLSISVSSEVSAEIREYERVSTTVVDAYVKPLVQTYVGRLNAGLKTLGTPLEASMMLSHGGIGTATDVAENHPVRMIESGPAAGAIAAAHFARRALVQPDAIAFDMGGTTAKISIIRNGEPELTHEFEVGHVHRFKRGSGYPLQISAIELLEIGAGGGSIAYVNELGLLKVGPQSAGAAPGPVCYGQGGARPTVTDADLVLGYLDPDHFLGGAMTLDVAAAKDALAKDVATPLSMSVAQVAWGVHDIVNESMVAATRAHAAEKGVDLRNFAMIAFGGAGPVHAYALARKLGLKRLICPYGAGVASAIGCLAAPPAVDLVTPHFSPLASINWTTVHAAFSQMRHSGEASLAKLVGDSSEIVMQRSMELRCQGQGYAVTVAIPDGDAISLPALHADFAHIYQGVYGHAPPDVPLEVVGLRARVLEPRTELYFAAEPNSEGADARKGSRPVCFDGAEGYRETPVYDRYRLTPGMVMPGPAVIEERETTIIVGPDASFHRDAAANIVIEFEG